VAKHRLHLYSFVADWTRQQISIS